MVVSSPQLSSRPRSRHDEILGALSKPHWLVEGTLLDNKWIVQIGDPENESPLTVDFDQPITPWPDAKSLADPTFELDLITIKLVFILALKPKPLGWITSKKSVTANIVNNYIDFIRWRTDRGVPDNKSLNAAWFNEYDASLKRRWREGLLNLTSRAETVLRAVDSNAITLPIDARGDVSGDALARLLGVRGATSVTPEARHYIEHYFQQKNLRYTRNSRERETPPPLSGDIVGTAAARHYKVWYDLWRLRSYLSHDPIGYRAFKTGRAVSKHCGKFFRDATRTEDAPAYQTSFLINASLKLVLDPIAERLVELVEYGVDHNGFLKNRTLLRKCNRRLKSLGFPELSESYHLYRGEKVDGTTLHQMIFRILPMAARTITAAFSARRDDEINKSTTNCVFRDETGKPWLNCLIAKNIRRVQKIPIPESVAKAVELVLKIRALGNRESQRLYDFWCPILRRNVYFCSKELTSFIRDYFRTPLLDDGTAWKFRPHQFRKFFGVTYFWRYAFPNLTALTYHYRHFNPETTRGYIEMEAAEGLRMRDEKLAAAARNSSMERKTDFESSRGEFALWVLRGVAKGDKLDGTLGKRITAQVEALQKQFLPEIQITGGQTSSPSFDKALSDIVAMTSLQVHPEGHSLCGWGSGPDDISTHRCAARCLELRRQLTGQSSADATGPDFAYAEDTGCLVCPLRAALPTMAPRWEKEALDAELALSCSGADQAPIINERIGLIREYA